MKVSKQPIVCRDPARGEWFRVKPGEERRHLTPLIRDAGTGDLYLVKGDLWPLLGSNAMWASLRACVNHGGALFVWPVPFPAVVGGPDIQSSPAAVLAELAEMKWVQVAFDGVNRRYAVRVANVVENLPSPVWPDMQFVDVLHEAFGGRVVTAANHPLLRGNVV